MIVEHVYDPTGDLVLLVGHRHDAPERGAAVKLQGDPAGLVFDGEVIGVMTSRHAPRLLFIDVDEGQIGVDSLKHWLDEHGDLVVIMP